MTDLSNTGAQQSQQSPQALPIPVALNVDHWQLVINCLGTQPFNAVADLILNIKTQVEGVFNARQAAAQAQAAAAQVAEVPPTKPQPLKVVPDTIMGEERSETPAEPASDDVEPPTPAKPRRRKPTAH